MKAEIQILKNLATEQRIAQPKNNDYFDGWVDALNIIAKVEQVELDSNLTAIHLEYKKNVKEALERYIKQCYIIDTESPAYQLIKEISEL